MTELKVVRFGFGPYDGASADGWHVMRGDESVAGPFATVDAADRIKASLEKATPLAATR